MCHARIVCLPDVAVVNRVVSCFSVNFNGVTEGCRPASCAVASDRTLDCTACPLDLAVCDKKSVTLAGRYTVYTCVCNTEIVDMYTVTAEATRMIADKLDCGICWDVGHANFGGHDQYAGIMHCGERLKVLHLHDNNGAADLHIPAFQGNINWNEVMRALHDVKFEGELNFEVAVSRVPDDLREPLYNYIAASGKLLREMK